jgi:hypothetical protein
VRIAGDICKVSARCLGNIATNRLNAKGHFILQRPMERSVLMDSAWHAAFFDQKWGRRCEAPGARYLRPEPRIL